MVKVIVFGPTGAVGAAAALEAHKQGAEVVLAMRDVSKATPKLPDLARVQADLSDPASVQKAVEESGAKAAFCYIAHGSDMKPVFKAMKEGGVEHVVLLSSWSVYPDLDASANGDDYIVKMHAVAEKDLAATGLKYTALRPNYFASNIYHQAEGLKKGQVFIYKPEKVLDYLSPDDIGSIGGAKLLGEPEIVPIAGPKLMTQRQAYDVINKEWKKDIKIIEIDQQAFIKNSPLPDFITKSLVTANEMSFEESYPTELYKQAAGSMKKYTGREPTTFEEFLASQTE